MEKQSVHLIIDETRRSIVDAMLAVGNLTGDIQYFEFAKNVCPSLSDSELAEIARHMDRFDDWPESFLLDSIIDYINLSDEQFCFFLEIEYVNELMEHSWGARSPVDFGLAPTGAVAETRRLSGFMIRMGTLSRLELR